jgi:hypothetical protein
MAGQAGIADPGAARVGEAIEAKARAGVRRRPASHRAEETRGLLDRLRAAIAA